MNKILNVLLVISLSLYVFSCKDNSVENTPQEPQGTLSVNSLPIGAKIFINGINSGKITPDTLMLKAAEYSVQLYYNGLDTTFTSSIKSNEKSTAYWNLNNSYSNLYVSSDIQGCEIFLDEVSTGKMTPDTLKKVFPGQYKLSLKQGAKITSQTIFIPKSCTQGVYLPFITSLYLYTTPLDAQIYLNGQSTGKITPDTIVGLTPNTYNITLKAYAYKDTTFEVSVSQYSHQSKYVSLKYDLQIQSFTDTKLWEYRDSANVTNLGLDLSTGQLYDISGADKDKVDVFYMNDGTIVSGPGRSVLAPNGTMFKASTTELINDGKASPRIDGSWTKKMSEQESSYVFLYDKDGHYSKIKIIRYGFTVPGVRGVAWVDFQWIYNKRIDDPNFK